MSTFDFDVIGDPLPPKRILPAVRMEAPQGEPQDLRVGQAPALPAADRGESRERGSP
jgi:hypothetical protein